MKTDLATTIITAILGAVMAFLICNLFLPDFKNMTASYKTITTPASSNVIEPDEDIFNSRAINPTVEVCVGICEGEEQEIITEVGGETTEESGEGTPEGSQDVVPGEETPEASEEANSEEGA